MHEWSNKADRCWHCSALTNYISLFFEAYLHPGECTDAKVKEFEEAVKGLKFTDPFGDADEDE